MFTDVYGGGQRPDDISLQLDERHVSAEPVQSDPPHRHLHPHASISFHAVHGSLRRLRRFGRVRSDVQRVLLVLNAVGNSGGSKCPL